MLLCRNKKVERYKVTFITRIYTFSNIVLSIRNKREKLSFMFQKSSRNQNTILTKPKTSQISIGIVKRPIDVEEGALNVDNLLCAVFQ